MLFAILIIFILLGVTIQHFDRAHYWDLPAFILIFGSSMLLLFAGLFAAVEQAEWIAAQAQYPQLVYASTHVKPNAAEDIAGQVAEANQLIASKQLWNRVVLIGDLIPDGWDTLKFIPLPEAQ